ncbi:hypothetical protein RRG08_000418 [Elysia crispata]|uniref:Uncharacterized protein n=1 Tax=Elysia crispata TaxID=231223 RepID=A0AAE1DLQ7_9GAST|nr:hypothetical protein RRG08_000418 [Elysia crispata]
MTWAGDCMVRSCASLNKAPAAVLCVVLCVLQMASLDYYLFSMLSVNELTWIAADGINIAFLVFVIVQARTTPGQHNKSVSSLGWVSWLLMNMAVSAKVSVLILFGMDRLEEEGITFWGANTLKTTIALGAIIFLLLLITQHDEELGSEGRIYIEELTGTVVFDIIDTVEIFDTLLDLEERKILWHALEEAILAVAVVNLMLPTVPLFTLARTHFGRKKLHKRLIYLHRILVVLIVNVPNLVLRMVLWHGHNIGISPFSLKNIVLIFLTIYEFYEHKKMKYEQHENEKNESIGGSGAGRDIESAKDKRFLGSNAIDNNGLKSSKDIALDNLPNQSVNGTEEDPPYEEEFGLESRVVTHL